MFSRRAIQRIAANVLITVLFAIASPVVGHAFAGSAVAAAAPGICSFDGLKADTTQRPALPQPGTVAHKPCVFCTSSVPLFPEAHAPQIVALLAGMPRTVQMPRRDALPPDFAATQPLSPRAPPAPI
jgi:hypothetical protein